LNLEEIRRIASENMANRRSHLEREPGHIFHHGLRTANLAGEIIARVDGEMNVFDPVLYTGALFHDVGKGFAAHNEAGADIARRLLDGVCAPADLDRVCEIIQFHCIRKHGLDLNTGVLAVQDADMIDHFGTQEIWLSFLFQAYSHGNQGDVIAYWDSDEFKKRTAKLRDLLNFDVSKTIYDDRVKFQESFHARLKLEGEGRVADKI
jgi:uncharacterized protein